MKRKEMVEAIGDTLIQNSCLNGVSCKRLAVKIADRLGEMFETTNKRMTMEIKNAVIESAKITTGGRGILDCWLSLDYGGCGQGFGGYALYLPKSWRHHKLESVAGHHIYRIMEIAGVEDWDKLKGKTIRVEADHGGVKRIGHIIKDDWFCPAEDYASLQSDKSNKEINSDKQEGGGDETT